MFLLTNGIRLASQELDLWAFCKNKAQDRKNWGKKDAARGYRKPEEIHESQNDRKNGHLIA
jgi:hypothetical protein